MDAPRPALAEPRGERHRAVRAIGTALCLFTLLSVLAVRAGEVSHHRVHHTAVVAAAADPSSQLRASQPLAVAAPVAAEPTLVATTSSRVVDSSRDGTTASAPRTRGPPGPA
jgi:hypothetical protein